MIPVGFISWCKDLCVGEAWASVAVAGLDFVRKVMFGFQSPDNYLSIDRKGMEKKAKDQCSSA